MPGGLGYSVPRCSLRRVELENSSDCVVLAPWGSRLFSRVATEASRSNRIVGPLMDLNNWTTRTVDPHHQKRLLIGAIVGTSVVASLFTALALAKKPVAVEEPQEN